MTTSRNGWVGVAVVVGLLIAIGVGPARAGSCSWTGNGNVNNSGNWSDGANWGGTAPGSADTGTLVNVTSGTRTVTVDTATSVLRLNWTPSGAAGNSSTDRMRLMANLTVGTMVASQKAYLDVNGYTVTVTTACSANQFPWVAGNGNIVKDGTWEWVVGQQDNHPPFTGIWTVKNGTLNVNGYNRFGMVYSNVTVLAGATLKTGTLSDFANVPRPILLNGGGYSSQGALWDGGNTYYQGITLQSDSAIAVDSAKIMQMFGVIDGGGGLLKSGSGTLVLMNANTYSGGTIVSNGTLKVLGSLTATTSITVKNGATLIGNAGHFPVTPVVEAGGTWLQDNVAAWSGNGNPDNSGNWSDTNNWYGQTVPTVAATLNSIAGAGTRYVTVDVATAVTTLTWPGTGGNKDRVVLGADLTVGTMDSSQNAYLDVNGRTLTLTNACAAGKFPWIVGTGMIIKDGTWTWTMNSANNPPYTGQWQVKNGLLDLSGYNRFGNTYSNLTVLSGGTVKVGSLSDWTAMPRPLILNGPGYLNQGALWDNGNTYNQSITVQSDASIFINSTKTMILRGALNGSGTLTITGGGTLQIESQTSAHNGMIVVTNATLNVPMLLPSVTNITVLAGGVLYGAQTHFPNATVVVNGGTWNSFDLSNAWSGNGNPDNSGNWSNPLNWFGGVPANEAVLPSVVGSTARTVTVDTVTSVPKLTWPGTVGKDVIRLSNNLTVGTVVADKTGNTTASAKCALLMNGYTVTITNACADGQMFYPVGGGTIVKQGTFTLQLNYDQSPQPFTGTWVAANGTLKLNQYNRLGPCSVIVQNGATLENQNNVDGRLPRLFLNGNGYNNAGAWNQTDTPQPQSLCTNAVTLQTDSKVNVASGKSLALYGPLDGPGVMTLTGSGTMLLSNTWNLAITGASANGIVVTNATLNIGGCTLSITNIGATAREYMIVDYSRAGATLTGAFVATNGLPAYWSIEQNTAKHPNAIYLIIPPPRGSVFFVR